MDTAPSLRRIASAAAALLTALAVAIPMPAAALTFNPLNVIPYETFRASSSMNAADIQAFLSTQSGPLKALVTTDYVDPQAGTAWKPGMPSKSAAQIIFEAAQRWNLNPKVIIATLQKEQSLITTSNSSNSTRYRKAMGCGVYDVDHDGTIENLFPGFGNQVWNGAKKLSTYEITYGWVPGKTKSVTVLGSGVATTIVPANASTFALYTYTPYYPQKLVWDTYTRFFGDPATPPRMRPVYRFRNRSNGTYFYTTSETKRYTLVRTSSSTWAAEGAAFSVDTSATANSAPVFQMYNTRTRKYLYTASSVTRRALLNVRPRQWRCDGVGFYVAGTGGTVAVYKLERKTNHGILYTSSASTKTALTRGSRAAFYYRGIAFRTAVSVPTSVPVGPSN